MKRLRLFSLANHGEPSSQSFGCRRPHLWRSGFLPAIDEALAQAATQQLAVMCSESARWRCHRRLIADFAEIARGVPVRHLMHDGQLVAHRRSPGVRLRADGLLVYDGGQEQLG